MHQMLILSNTRLHDWLRQMIQVLKLYGTGGAVNCSFFPKLQLMRFCLRCGFEMQGDNATAFEWRQAHNPQSNCLFT